MKILPPSPESIRFAADALRCGQLIGFPTETVYGIAASATDREAILNTFALKNRPADNPLIVHVDSLDAATELVQSIPDAARRLAEAFWPGPLTIVLPKSPKVPAEATGGHDTVAIRVPKHPVALAILTEAGIPLTAPSANPFMGLSPTSANHIAPEILAGLACVIDGGRCKVGVESTVVDCSGLEISILRPGVISRVEIEDVLNQPVNSPQSIERKSPGMYKRHYSPRTPIRLVESLGADDPGIVFGPARNASQFSLPKQAIAYAHEMYSTLYALDQLGCNEILIELPPLTSDWEAVHDRLNKAQG